MSFHNFDMLSRFRFKSCFSCFGIFHNFTHHAMFFLSQSSRCWQDWRSLVYAKPSIQTDEKLFIALDCLLSSPLLSSLHHCLLIVLSSLNNEIALDLSGWDVIEMNEERKREMREIRWGNASDANGTFKLTQLFQFIDTYSRDKRWAHDRQTRVRVFWVFCLHSHE